MGDANGNPGFLTRLTSGRALRFGLLLVLALGLGWGVSGDLLYHSLIGLDSSAFPLGEWIQATLAPSVTKAVGGIVVAVLFVLLLGVLGFVFGRRTTTPDPDGRRKFLAGSAAGASAFAAGTVGMLAHTFYGVGKRGEGWMQVQGQISSDDGVVKTDPNPN